MAMDFGIFYEIELRKPYGPRAEYDVFQQVIAQVVEAERVGFSNFWSVEHHFLSEFAYSSAPEVLYGALSQRTSKIRIGHGVRLLPFPYNHPIRVAEMGATVDLLCEGRMEFGTGRSVSRDELEGFGINPSETRALWEEALEVVVGAWTNEVFSWEGKYFKIPPREIIPKPLQKPHPPLWCASTGPETHEVAGRKGVGLLSFTLLVDPEELKRRIGIYRDGLARAKPVGKFINDRAATFTMVHCAETNKEARENAKHAFEWYARKAFDTVASVGIWQSGKTDMGTYDYLKQMMNVDPATINFDYMDQNDMIICGDPDTCIRKVKRYQEAGCQQLLCFMQIYDIPHQKVMDSIKLWGKHVIPYFK
jgi:alkanesulfonate monooxygenase SsuD/methylene tetrahydromethanopterin reductase-like flavin-dependent oxidoreductase (luciferase family)